MAESRERKESFHDPNVKRGKNEEDISRQEVLRGLFGNVGELMDDFSCAVDATILLHGRLYVTDRFVCFYSNLFGLEKKIRIPYSHVTVVTKENTALIIPNAIAINTFKKTYMFRSFWDRDHCFFMLKSCISKNALRESESSSKLGAGRNSYSIKDKNDGRLSMTTGVEQQVRTSRSRTLTDAASGSKDSSPRSSEYNASQSSGDAAGGNPSPSASFTDMSGVHNGGGSETRTKRSSTVVVGGGSGIASKASTPNANAAAAAKGDTSSPSRLGAAAAASSSSSPAPSPSSANIKAHASSNAFNHKSSHGKMGAGADPNSSDDDRENSASAAAKQERRFDHAEEENYDEDLDELREMPSTATTATTTHSGDHAGMVSRGSLEDLNLMNGDAFEAIAAASKLKSVVVSGIVQASVSEFYHLFVADAAPHSWLKYHEICGDSQLSVSPWTEKNTSAPSTSAAAKDWTREMKFHKNVNLPGLKSTRGVKLQRMQRCGMQGLVVHSSTRLEDVPAADTFSVEDVVQVKMIDDKSVEVSISFEVRFVKSTFIRWMIENSTSTEMHKWLNAFHQHLVKCAVEKIADRNVKLASFKRVLDPVARDSDSEGSDDEHASGSSGAKQAPSAKRVSEKSKRSKGAKVLNKVGESVITVVNEVQTQVVDSLESWQRVEGRRFFVLCFSILFFAGLAVYVKLRALASNVGALQMQLAELGDKLDEALRSTCRTNA